MLYKYLKSKYALKIIKTNRIKATPPNEFSDPFEFLPSINKNMNYVVLSKYLYNEEYFLPIRNDLIKIGIIKKDDKITRDLIENNKKIISNIIKNRIISVSNKTIYKLCDTFSDYVGVICFSKTNSDILLWSHYADSFRGICLGFDFDNADIDVLISKKINYSSKRALISPLFFKEGTSRAEDTENILFTKYNKWSYEKEYRLAVNLEKCSKECNKYYFQLPKNALKEIIFADRIDKKEKGNIVKYINKNKLMIKIQDAILDNKKYKIKII
jgi:hypothetical protein